MFYIAYAFKGKVHVFEGQVKIVSHSSCRKSAILKYFCPLHMLHNAQLFNTSVTEIGPGYGIFIEVWRLWSLWGTPHQAPS